MMLNGCRCGGLSQDAGGSRILPRHNLDTLPGSAPGGVGNAFLRGLGGLFDQGEGLHLAEAVTTLPIDCRRLSRSSLQSKG